MSEDSSSPVLSEAGEALLSQVMSIGREAASSPDGNATIGEGEALIPPSLVTPDVVKYASQNLMCGSGVSFGLAVGYWSAKLLHRLAQRTADPEALLASFYKVAAFLGDLALQKQDPAAVQEALSTFDEAVDLAESLGDTGLPLLISVHKEKLLRKSGFHDEGAAKVSQPRFEIAFDANEQYQYSSALHEAQRLLDAGELLSAAQKIESLAVVFGNHSRMFLDLLLGDIYYFLGQGNVGTLRKAGQHYKMFLDSAEHPMWRYKETRDLGLWHLTRLPRYDEVQHARSNLEVCEKAAGPISTGLCFVATAVYGSPVSAEVNALRTWRDQVLIGTTSGRRVVALYEKLSPPLAEWIARHRTARWLIRTFVIAPFAKVIKRNVCNPSCTEVPHSW